MAQEYKIVVLGGGGVGKSAMIIRFVTDNFLDEYDPTIEDSYRKQVEVDGQPALCDILDTAGQEEFSSMQDQWMREGRAFILIYSITGRSWRTEKRRIMMRDDLGECSILRDKILRCKDLPNSKALPLVLVGTKADLEDRRAIPREEAQKLADEWGCPHLETSAKDRINIIEAFEAAVRRTREICAISDEEWEKESKKSTSCKTLLLYCCIGIIYICFLGCICHGLYLLFKKFQDWGCCQCGRCIKKICNCKRKDNANKSKMMQDWEEREKRNQLKLLFKKVNFVTKDELKEPIISLKRFKVSRKFSLIRFIKTLLCGLFLPIVIVFQTFVFLTYRQGREMFFYGCFYPKGREYDDIHYSLTLDILGLVVGRHPKEDPDATKDRDWFLRQTQMQKLQRVGITILLCTTFLIVFYNGYQINDQDLRVSLMESVGPFSLFWIIWLLLSCWIAYGSELKPRMPDTYRLRSIKLYLGEDFTHMTDAHKFLRAYSWSRNKRWKLPMLHTMIIVFLGLLYACIPGLTRWLIGDESDGLEERHFITQPESTVQIGAILVNFILVSSFVYAIEVQYSKHFDNYREWMYDLTMLLHKTPNNTKNTGEDEHYMPKKGRNFSKDIFLSLTRKSNGLGWLEIRSFLAAEGKLLFAQQELPTLWLLLLTTILTIYIVWRVFLIGGNPLKSVLFNGATILCVICLVSLIRIAITGYQFERIQAKQTMLLGEQRFFMRCRPTSKSTNNSEFNGAHAAKKDAARGKDLIKDDDNAESEMNIKINDTTIIDANDKNKEKPTKELINFVAEEIKMAEQKETEMVSIETNGAKKNIMEDQDGETESDDEDENEQKYEERKPLIERKDESIMDDTDFNSKFDKFGFIDNMLFIVQRKEIYPGLFGVKLNSVLAKAIGGVVISGVAAVAKLVFE